MSLKKSTYTAQPILHAEFTFNFDDTMVDANGNTVDFGKTAITSTYAFDAIQLPPGAVVVGGEVVTETAFDTAAYSVTIGDSSTANRYMAATDKKATGRTALVPTGYHNTGGLSVRIGITNTDVCTTGVMTVRVDYVIDGRVTDQV